MKRGRVEETEKGRGGKREKNEGKNAFLQRDF